MKRKITNCAFLLIPAAMLLAACHRGGTGQNIQADPLEIKKIADFSGDYSSVYASSGYGNGAPFNVEWSSNDAKVANGELNLSIHKNAEGREYPWTGGEMRTKSFYGYGDFSVRMKPAKVVGTASTFFTYTGEWDSETKHPSTGETDTRNPGNPDGVHDEIDIEFLGKDTTKVQFNYFTNGRGGNEYMYELGFDASLEYHTYGFRWEKTQITWFVDDKPVYRATDNIPSHPGRVITNYWCGTNGITGAEGWMGKYTGENPAPATYQWLGATGEAKETHKEPTTPVTPTSSGEPASENEWDAIDAIDIDLLEADDCYETSLSADNKSLDVTYTNVPKESYHNLSLDIPESLRNSSSLYFELENKGETPVQVRADVNAAEPHGTNNITAINTSAILDGNSVYTDTSWGGSKFDLGAGQKSKVVVNYDGVPTNLMFMIDSAIYQDKADSHAGHIEISNLKVKTDGEYIPEETSSEGGVVEPVESSSGEEIVDPVQSSSEEEIVDPVQSSESEVTPSTYQLNFESNATYTCVNANGESKITYASVDDNTYQNVYSNIVCPAEATMMTLDFKNDGPESVQINVDLGTNTDGNTTSRLIKDEPENDGSFAPYDWFDNGNHRAQYNIGAGETRSLTFKFDQTDGAVNAMLMFINSCWAQETATHTNGNMTLSNVVFA